MGSRAVLPSRFPVASSPMAGGPSTPELVAAVSAAGGLGVLAAGYRSAEHLATEIEDVRARLGPGIAFGVNLFAPVPGPADPAVITGYGERVARLARQAGAELGEPRFDDDDFERKLHVVRTFRPHVVTFAFGRPEPFIVEELQRAGIAVWVTVTSLDEARLAAEGGADAIVAQGAEAGGHRGGFEDGDETPLPLSELLEQVRAAGPAIIAAGGIMDADDAARARAAGADAVQAGTAFLLADEAGTSEVHRAAVAAPGSTVLTRAFSGRLARGIANAWTAGVGLDAPSAYPEVHHLTVPLRAQGRAAGDPDLVNLWAGTEHQRARPLPASDIVGELARGWA